SIPRSWRAALFASPATGKAKSVLPSASSCPTSNSSLRTIPESPSPTDSSLGLRSCELRSIPDRRAAARGVHPLLDGCFPAFCESELRSGRGPTMRESEPLFGLHVVREALSARHRKFRRLLVAVDQKGVEVEHLTALAHEAGVPVDFVSRGATALRAGPSARTQGVVLEAGPIPERTLAALRGGERGRRRLVALDGVEDPQNLGAIARVAEAAGAQGLVLTRHRSPPLSAA